MADRVGEVEALRRYWEWLAEAQDQYADVRILFGDYNLEPNHEGWHRMREVALPLITEGATTLATGDRQYSHLYDNIWVPRQHALPLGDVGIMPFPVVLTEVMGEYWNHGKARDRVSDHAPVYATLGGVQLHNPAVAEIAEDAKAGCIDLNTASARELAELPPIGDTRAQAITEERPWRSVDELTRIHGIGPERLGDIQESGDACVEG